MILKERNAKPGDGADRTSIAGARAEVQLAHYLRRAFADDPALAVINDLRIAVDESSGDFAQIDHLIVHRYGLVVIESKSVAESVVVNAAQEWSRSFGGKLRGMPSPVRQAERQAEALRRILTGRFDPIRLRLFSSVAVDIVVAVSDHGIIDRGGHALSQVVKADTVCDIVRRLSAGNGRPKAFDGTARKQIAEFLISIHSAPEKSSVKPAAIVPQKRLVQTITPAPAPGPKTAKPSPGVRSLSPSTSPVCRFCGSGALHAQWGKNYYFRCLKCTKNTPMAKACPVCGAFSKIRKDKLNFFTDCPSCGRTTRVYTNAALTELENFDEEPTD